MTTLKEYRKQHGLSQRKLAEALSEALGKTIHHQYVANWERTGKVPAEVARLLDVDEDAAGQAALEPPAEVGEDGEHDAGGGPAAGADEAPADRPPRPRGTAAQVIPTGRQLEGRIRATYELVGESLVKLGEPYDGQVLKALAPQAAQAWVAVCDQHANVARVWNWLTFGWLSGEEWAMLAFVHAPAAVAILAHHGLLPELSLFPKQSQGATHGQDADSDGGAGAAAAVAEPEAQAAG